VAIVPLAIERGALRFLASPHADVNEALLDPEAGDEVFDAALSALYRHDLQWDRCVLENVPDGSPTRRFVDHAGRHVGARAIWIEGGDCPALTFGPDPEAALRAVLGKAHLRQLRNKLARQGRVTFRPIHRLDEVQAILPRFVDQHVKRWAAAGEPSAFLEPGPRAFLTALTEQLHADSTLRFAALELDGRPIAYHLGFASNGRFVYYKPTFDLDAWDFSPGQVLLAHLIEQAARSGEGVFDLGLGTEAYKARLSDHAQAVQTFEIDRGLTRRARTAVFLGVRQALQHVPPAARAVRGLMHSTQDIRARARHNGWPAVLASRARLLFRDMIYDRFEVVVSVRHPGPDALEDDFQPGQDRFPLEPGNLNDMAELVLTDPGTFDGAWFQKTRELFRKGDRCWIVRIQGSIAHVIFEGHRREVRAPGTADCVPLREPCRYLHHALTTAQFRGQDVGTAVLRQLAAQSAARDEPLLIAADVKDVPCRRAIETVAFQPVLRTGRVSWFGRMRRAWCTVLDRGSRVLAGTDARTGPAGNTSGRSDVGGRGGTA
jgi:CelD/BcsL family acetyltransferase involved in cellulose biosynthesis